MGETEVVAFLSSLALNSPFSDPKAYRFGSPGGFEIKGRWGAVAAFGSMPTLFFFSLPAGCAQERSRLSVALEVSQGGQKANHQLIFSER